MAPKFKATRKTFYLIFVGLEFIVLQIDWISVSGLESIFVSIGFICKYTWWHWKRPLAVHQHADRMEWLKRLQHKKLTAFLGFHDHGTTWPLPIAFQKPSRFPLVFLCLGRTQGVKKVSRKLSPFFEVNQALFVPSIVGTPLKIYKHQKMWKITPLNRKIIWAMKKALFFEWYIGDEIHMKSYPVTWGLW